MPFTDSSPDDFITEPRSPPRPPECRFCRWHRLLLIVIGALALDIVATVYLLGGF